MNYIKRLLWLIPAALVLMIITTCEERIFNNPWDEKSTLAPESWAPSNLQIEDVSITEKKLTWSYGDHHIEGIKIDRKKGEDPWQQAIATLPKEARSWSDTEIIPDPSLEYSYRLYAFAGKNSSTQQTTSSSAAIPPPTNLNLEKISDVSYKLTWTDNSNGEEGFRIDRKTGTDDWEIAFGVVDANQTELVDENVFSQKKSTLEVQYRVYAWYGSYESEKAYADTEAQITAPTNLQIAVNSITSVTLTWQDKSEGEEGFRIDRKVGDGDWQVEFAAVPANQTTYTDDNVNLADNIYSYRVYAYNGKRNSAYSDAAIHISAPTVTTSTISNITATTATSGGNVTNDGGLDVYARGVVWNTGVNPSLEDNYGYTEDGAGTGTFTSNITGLTANTTYYVRAYATNSAGTAYGNQLSFLTSDGLPKLTTAAISELTSESAVSGGNITSDEGLAVTSRGVVWSTGVNPTLEDNHGYTEDGTGTGTFTSNLTNLERETTYYVSAYAITSIGTFYGNILDFKTFEGTVTDIDGNIYPSVIIGSQEWMAKNLKTTRYNNGDAISNVTDGITWRNSTNGAYSYYNNDNSYADTYGAIYNIYAVKKGNLCPAGWRVPNDDDFQSLEMYIGMSEIDALGTGWRGTDQGSQLKSVSGWNNNGNGTNTIGFNALPGGNLSGFAGNFEGISTYGSWWTSTGSGGFSLYIRMLQNDRSGVYRFLNDQYYGSSVRCIKN